MSHILLPIINKILFALLSNYNINNVYVTLLKINKIRILHMHKNRN